jgi:hypothetical protein
MVLPLFIFALIVVLIGFTYRRPDPRHDFLLSIVQLLDYEHHVGTDAEQKHSIAA